MTRSNPAAPIITALALLILGGCASGGSPLQQAQNSIIRELTSQCYWHNDGHRAVFGGYQVHSACRRWAAERVRVRFPNSVSWDH